MLICQTMNLYNIYFIAKYKNNSCKKNTHLYFKMRLFNYFTNNKHLLYLNLI